MVWHCTGQHCSSETVCVCVSFICQWRPLVSVITTLLCSEDNFSLSSVVLHAFSALWMYSTFGHHPHPLGYLWAKFCFFRGVHCWGSPWRKSHTPSITNPAFLCPGNRSLHFGTYTRSLAICARCQVTAAVCSSKKLQINRQIDRWK